MIAASAGLVIKIAPKGVDRLEVIWWSWRKAGSLIYSRVDSQKRSHEEVAGDSDCLLAGCLASSAHPENVRGRFLLFAGGVPLYRKIFAEVAAKGYEGFELR
jgi:hypothetical protein